MKVRFLLDENLSPRFKNALLRHNPAIDVLRVGDAGTPPLGTLDPDILHYAAQQQRVLVTENRKSMPTHVTAFLAAGEHTWGVLRISARATFGMIIEELALIWEASEAEEWIDQFRWLPLQPGQYHASRLPPPDRRLSSARHYQRASSPREKPANREFVIAAYLVGA